MAGVMADVCCLFRSELAYRRSEFLSGLERLGYKAHITLKRHPDPGDILLLWNRRQQECQYATHYEKAGATVIVAENGYLSSREAKSYALAIGHHNGAGIWRVGGPERWAGMGIELHPWRSVGDFLLILAQRGIGEPGVAMPGPWPHQVYHTLPARTAREVRLRRHPGQDKTEPYDALAGAHAAVTWGSGAAIKALAHGYPVFTSFPRWIGAGAAQLLDQADFERPFMDDDARMAMFERLAWAQWSMAEIVSGEAFAWLLQR
ncbi:MAG TPA: hypothetical protein VIJ94_05580 [Caulobacteraceae bacterium]